MNIFKQIADAADKATKTITVKVKSTDYYARQGDLDDEYIQIIDPDRFIEELNQLAKATTKTGDGEQGGSSHGE